MTDTAIEPPIDFRARVITLLPRLGIFLSMLALDQWTKRWIIGRFEYGQVEPITSFFNLTRLHNEGAAFSFLANAGGWQKSFFIGLGIVVSTFIAAWLWRLPRTDHKLLGSGLALILSGAIGNVIDRIAYGHVIDFLDFFVKGHHWPAFNVADSCIFAGAVLVLLDAFINGDRTQANDDKVKEENSG